MLKIILLCLIAAIALPILLMLFNVAVNIIANIIGYTIQGALITTEVIVEFIQEKRRTA